MFWINVSNHEFNKEQQNAVGFYYTNWEFPNIPSDCTKEDVVKLVMKTIDDIEKHNLAMLQGDRVYIHIMGEMVFVHNFVKLAPWRCHASVTERIVVEEKDGKKTSQFKFAGFREY